MEKSRYLRFCLATALPLGFVGGALAQAVAPTQPVGTYQLSGTSISGSSQSTAVILTTPVNADQAAIKTESGVYLYPTAFAGFGHNDNILNTETNQTSSNFLILSPQLVAELKHKGNRYTALARIDGIRYSDSSQDNVTNSELNIAGDNYFSSRARAGWSIGRLDSSDGRGTNERANAATPDRWHANTIDGRLIYGAPEAAGRFEMDLGYKDKAYDTNRETSALGDHTLQTIAGRGFYRVGSRTLALLEVRQSKADYDSATSVDDNTERRYYAGLTWEATAATTGIVKVGRMTKDFDLSGKESHSGSSWEAAVRWSPRTYSVVDLSTSRTTADATGFGNYTLNTGTDVTWNHKWTQSLNSRVGFGVLDTDYAGTTRTDSAKNYSLAVDYAVLRWLKVGADFARTDNSSNEPGASYKRNVTMFTLNASL